MEFSQYDKISVATDGIIITTDCDVQSNNRKEPRRNLQILMIKRNIPPFMNKWCLLGGFVEVDKSPELALKEKLFSKANIPEVYTKQFHTYGDMNRDPRGRVISITHLMMGTKDKFSDIKENGHGKIAWFWAEYNCAGELILVNSEDGHILDESEIGFDHYRIIQDAFREMRINLVYTDIAFQLVPEQFTIRELQDVYESLIGKEAYSFRKTVADRIEETGSYSEIKAHRPAKLYRLKDMK